jgi:hypothetical protein
MDKVPIYLYYWHVLKAWRLCGIEKIKDVKVWGGILQDLHDVINMSINHGETIDDFKECGRVIWEKAFINIGLVMCGQIISKLITISLVNDNIYHGLIFKIVCNNVIHPCALCLCL